jgi:potassium-transporting ATPase KdpC subunit
MPSLPASLRVAAATLAVCVVGYTVAILAVARILTPDTADGSLITASDGTVLGSRLIAQAFSDPGYFWPRPSAVGYNAAGAGGSNKSPTSPDLTARADSLVARYGATSDDPVPPELVAASGSGLDPDISEDAARYQAPRVADARGVARARVEALIGTHAFSPGGVLTAGRIVNVLELNLALDSVAPTR